MRLSLELLLRHLLGNDKSLEKQQPIIGAFLKERGASPEIGNLLHRVMDIYTSYQNNYVKHDDAVKADEVDMVVELTIAPMRQFLRVAASPADAKTSHPWGPGVH